MQRRDFLQSAATGAFALAAWNDALQDMEDPRQRLLSEGPVKLTRDGLDLEPKEYAWLLGELAKHPSMKEDSYSRGGVVAALEEAFAQAVGKPRAVFFPTGTLANHVAIRRLCAGRGRRVVVPAESHLFNDCGDCCQTLSGLHLIPVDPGSPTVTAAALKEVARRTATGRVAMPLGALMIESPVRRQSNRRQDFEEMKAVANEARRLGMGLHLDGARIFTESIFSGVPVKTYAAMFDTVYVSLYKAFHTPTGAVLTGPPDLLDGLYHERRMFGAGLPRVWPFAAVALLFLDGMKVRMSEAKRRGDIILAGLKKSGDFDVTVFPDGTNVVLLRPHVADLKAYATRVRKRGVHLPKPHGDPPHFAIKINETLLRREPDAVLAALKSL